MTRLNLWIEVFLRSFLHYLVLPAMLLLIVALLVAAPLPLINFGATFGIPDVINHDDFVKRVFVGSSLGVLWLAVLYSGYLLWLKDCRDKRVDLPVAADNAAGVPAPGAAANPDPDDQAAARLSFSKYAWAISWRFFVSLSGVILVFLLLNWGVPKIARIQHGPPAEAVVPRAAGAVVDDGVPGCEELAMGDALWWRILTLWLAFLITIAGFLLIWFTPEEGWFWSWHIPGGRWAAVLVLGALLFGFVGYYALHDRAWPQHEWLLRFGALAGVFLFWSVARWRTGATPQNTNVPPPPAAPGWKIFVVLFVMALYLFGLVYPVVTGLMSQDWVLGWTGGFFFLVLTQWLVQVFRTPLKEVQRALGFPKAETAGANESRARRQGWRLTLLGISFYILICGLPFTKSAGTFIAFFFFGLVVAYALVSLYFHRAVFALGAVLLFLLIFSGVQPYHFRLPGLEYGNLRPLTVCVQEEAEAQQALERLMSNLDGLSKSNRAQADYYQAFEDANAALKKDNPRILERVQKLLELLPGEDDRHRFLEEWQRLKDQEVKLADQRSKDLKAKLQTFVDSTDKQREEVLKEWRQHEKDNHVIPVRIPPADLRQLLYWPVVDRTPEASEPLIPIEDIEFGDKTQPVVVITVSGGGIRSAAWAFVVLKELELYFANEGINFPHQVRLITGASGGMLGASYYVELLAKNALTFPAPDDPEQWKQLIRARETLLRDKYCQHLTKDALTPIMQQMVLGDIPSFFSPWPNKYDRGRALEDAWLENLEASLDRTFVTFRDQEKQGNRPFLVFSPMLVEDGRRLLISNLDLRPVVVNDGNLLTPDPVSSALYNSGIYSREALELFRLFPQAYKQFKLSTAVRMSASFPFFSPAVSLPTAPRRRVVDAGYYDNYGVSLAASWLFSDRNRDTFRNKTPMRFLLIQIRDTRSDEERALTMVRSAPATSPGRALEEFSSPVEGLYNSRDGSSSFRNDGQLELLSQFLTKLDEIKFGLADTRYPRFTVLTFELDSPAPLSWYLSDAERTPLWQAIKHPSYQDRLKLGVDWWKNGTSVQ